MTLFSIKTASRCTQREKIMSDHLHFATEVASTAEIRAHFPALERYHREFPVAYFDGPGGTQVPRSVGEVMADYLYYHNANTHWAYPTSAETDAAIAHARQALADSLQASSQESIFGAVMIKK